MRCPWCDFAAGPRALHAHLGERHAAEVRTAERNERFLYQITCPLCGARYEHLVRKAARDPEFIEGFGREIAMVALDMLVHHMVAEHEHPEAEPSGAEPSGAEPSEHAVRQHLGTGD